jgi:metal-responsive CopG/Arc/MetJ family transcriptional regulator
MEKKTIMIEISAELIDKIDSLNTMGDRSEFISHLLNEQIEKPKKNESSSLISQTTKIDIE